MASQAIETQGTLIQRENNGSPSTYTTIGEIVSFNGPGGSASIIDVTSLDSEAKEKLIGLKDEGQFTLECNLVPDDAGQTGLRSDRDNRTKRGFRVILTDDSQTTLIFQAYVLGFSIGGGVDDKVSLSITLEITGQVTWS